MAGRLPAVVVLRGPAPAEAALAALLVVVSRWPLRTRYLMNWDAAQFALGIRHFDLVHHQPHPPGYLAYIAAGRALEPLFGDANSALVALSVAGEALAAALALLLAREVFGPGAGRLAAAALILSPLFWFYGAIANVYALEPALALLVAWPAWRCWQGQAAAAPCLGLALGLAGAFRPSTAALLAPLAVGALLRCHSGRAVFQAALPAGLLTLAWLVPVSVLAGGAGAFWAASVDLGASVTSGTAIWRAGPGGLVTTSQAVALGTVWALGGLVVVLFHGLVIAPRLVSCRALPAGWAAFTALWILPGLGVFLLVHIGQVVYVQLVTTALVPAVGPALERTFGRLDQGPVAPAGLAALALTALAIFALPPEGSLAGTLRGHDAAVAATMAVVGAEDPGRTVLLTDALAAGSYRTAQVYLPRFPRVAIGRDASNRLGEIYGDRYEPWNFARARPLELPDGADTFIFLDRAVVEEEVGDPERLIERALPGGARVFVFRGRSPTIRAGRLWLGPPGGRPADGQAR